LSRAPDQGAVEAENGAIEHSNGIIEATDEAEGLT